MTPDNTICAISTAPGKGGIAVARVSGPEAVAVCDRIWRGKPLADAATHTAHLGTVLDRDGKPLDSAVATVFRAPCSFTGEDVVELSVHGSRFVQRELVSALINAGARLAEPGEFTQRAFVNGKLDLAQAEAVADIIASENRAAHRIAMSQMRGRFSSRLNELRCKLLDICALLELELDFSEEDVEFASRTRLLELAQEVKAEVDRLSSSFSTASAIKDGIPVAIVGVTNAGKSSLLNAMLQDDRAIVSDIDGTTRDVVEDKLEIGDYTFHIMDTAGIRQTADRIEALGIERSRKAAATARIIILVIDSTTPALPPLPQNDAPFVVVLNKSDLAHGNIHEARTLIADLGNTAAVVETSAATGTGIDQVLESLRKIAEEADESADAVMVANARHYQALQAASESVERAIDAIRADLSGDLIAMDIRLTVHHLGSILGTITSQEILTTIFSRFCIGK